MMAVQDEAVLYAKVLHAIYSIADAILSIVVVVVLSITLPSSCNNKRINSLSDTFFFSPSPATFFAGA